MRPIIALAAGFGAFVAVGFVFAALAPGHPHRRIYSLIWAITLIVAGTLAIGIPLAGLAAFAAGTALRVWVGARLAPRRSLQRR